MHKVKAQQVTGIQNKVNGTVYIEKDGQIVQIAIAATSQSCDFF